MIFRNRSSELVGMYANSRRSILGDESAVDASCDWRSRSAPNIRKRVVNMIVITLRKHIVGWPNIPHELKTAATRFEENKYFAATSESSYLRQISVKMLNLETIFYQNPQDPGSDSIQYLESVMAMALHEPDLNMTVNMANLHI